jgi:hypothetical protein
LIAADTICPIIDNWRDAGAVRPVMADETPGYDPTRYTTADLLAEVREKPLGGPSSTTEQPPPS